MELQVYKNSTTINSLQYTEYEEVKPVKNHKAIIEANTTEVEFDHLKYECTIPVFAKDNERTISHHEFIEAARSAVSIVFGDRSISEPEIRVSHTIKGRIPEAIHKNASELQDHERTIYYERMAFAFEIGGFSRTIGGNELSLTVGGVRAYNHENLYNKKSLEHFKFFIGFKNMVCCNMCVRSDGFLDDLKVGSVFELTSKMIQIIKAQLEEHLHSMQQLTGVSISEQQFAQILGKCRLYQYLPKDQKSVIPSLQFNDTQINAVARDYFQDESFVRNSDGEINLWKMYNLFTGANKSSYIDLFLQRSVNSFNLATGIGEAMQNSHSSYRWFIE